MKWKDSGRDHELIKVPGGFYVCGTVRRVKPTQYIICYGTLNLLDVKSLVAI